MAVSDDSKPESAAGVEVYGDGMGDDLPQLPELASTQVVIAPSGDEVIIDTVENETILAVLPVGNSSRSSKDGKKDSARTSREGSEPLLDVKDPLAIEIFHLQHPLAPGERKEATSLTRAQALVWRDKLKAIADAKDRERTEQFETRVAAAVQKAMAGVPLTQSEKEQQLETEFQTALKTVQGGLDAERRVNNDLRERLASMEAAKVNTAQQTAVAPVLDARPETTPEAPVRRSLREWFIEWIVFLLAVLIVGSILGLVLIYGLPPLSKAIRDWSNESETVGDKPRENAAELSRRRSTPSDDELDNHPAIQRTRALIERNRKLLE